MNGYHVDDTSGLAMLVPDASQNRNSSVFQTVTLTLPAGPRQSKIDAQDNCVIQGAMFSLFAGFSSRRSSWIIRSPSLSGWDTLSGRMDANAQWRLFVRELARLHDHDCFAPGLSTQFLRSSITERIPLPANLVPTFLYSDQGERFVNVAPGMQVRIQKVLSARTPANAGQRTLLRMMTVDYDVVPRHGGGIRLRLTHRPEGIHGSVLTTEEHQLLTLEQRFSTTPVLRLFLEGFSEEKQGRSESAPMLIGTSDTTQLDVFTDLVRQKEPITCVSQPSVVCVDLPSGGVSLSSIIWINGRQTITAFGASLGSLLLRLPESKQAEALGSVQVVRKLNLGDHAIIQFTRTVEGATQLLLLPGDRIEWKD